MEVRSRRDLARYAAPAAFLVAITILVVLVHSALSSGGGGETTTAAQPATTQRATTHATTTTRPRTTTTSSTATTSTTPAGAQYYTIQSGDTFGSIAAAEGTTIGALEQLNPDVNPNALSVGQQIRIK
jgi:LysM repeat protein